MKSLATLSTRLHMSGVAEVDAALSRPLIATVLQANDALAGTQLLFGKVPYVLLSFLRADVRLAEIMSLKNEKINTTMTRFI